MRLGLSSVKMYPQVKYQAFDAELQIRVTCTRYLLTVVSKISIGIYYLDKCIFDTPQYTSNRLLEDCICNAGGQ